MKLLFITPESPYPPARGYSLIAYHQIRLLSQRHTVDLISFTDPRQPLRMGGLPGWCRRIDTVPLPHWRSILNMGVHGAMGAPLQVAHYASRRMRSVVDAALARDAYDVVVFQLTRMAQFLPRSYGGVRVLMMVDPFALSYRRSLVWRGWAARAIYAAEAGRLERYEARVAPRFDYTTFVSPADVRDYAACMPGIHCAWAPHAVDADAFAPDASVVRRPGSVVMTGNMFYAPNVDGVNYFCREVWPRVLQEEPGAHLTLVGARPAAAVQRWAEHAAVTVTGDVADVRPFLNRAAVSICPVRLSAGVQTKVLEALAMGTPVVTTSAGNNGINAVPGEHLQVADDPALYAAHVVALLRGEGWARLSGNGREFVRRHYSWELSAARFEEILAHAVRSRQRINDCRRAAATDPAMIPADPSLRL